MNDEVAVVKQNPPRLVVSLPVVEPGMCACEALRHAVGNRPSLSRGGGTHDEKVIGKGAHPPEIQQDKGGRLNLPGRLRRLVGQLFRGDLSPSFRLPPRRGDPFW